MRFVGTCVDCFDADGECLTPELGWANVSAFACDEEVACVLPENPGEPDDMTLDISEATKGHDVRWLESPNGVVMLFDADADIHYFFVMDAPRKQAGQPSITSKARSRYSRVRKQSEGMVHQERHVPPPSRRTLVASSLRATASALAHPTWRSL